MQYSVPQYARFYKDGMGLFEIFMEMKVLYNIEMLKFLNHTIFVHRMHFKKSCKGKIVNVPVCFQTHDYSIIREERNRKCIIHVLVLHLNSLFISKESKITIQSHILRLPNIIGCFIFFTALAYNKRFDVSEYGMADLDDLLSELPATSIVVSSFSRISLANKVAYLINNAFMQLNEMNLC